MDAPAVGRRTSQGQMPSHGLGPAQPAALNGPLGAVEAGLDLVQAMLFAFLGGLILNIMPCVFPILSMKAASLAGAATRPASARAEGLAFLAGVMIAFLALGGLLVALRAGGEAADAEGQRNCADAA